MPLIMGIVMATGLMDIITALPLSGFMGATGAAGAVVGVEAGGAAVMAGAAEAVVGVAAGMVGADIAVEQIPPKQAGLSRPAAYKSLIPRSISPCLRNSRLSSLPVAVFGNSGRMKIFLGT